ncbi:hypothetical protein BT69DRAFT_863417 [Atractiella rhizophila]|nr:hypothetical protein BT69DRAFT_863417 [Atractiella rhizophila]
MKSLLSSISSRLGGSVSSPSQQHLHDTSPTQQITQLLQALPPEMMASIKQAMDEADGLHEGVATGMDGVGAGEQEEGEEDIPIAPELIMNAQPNVDFLHSHSAPPQSQPLPSGNANTSTNTAGTKRKRNLIMPSSSTTATTKGHRRPELSKAVRSTMFSMLGFQSGRFHGYSPSPTLPDYDTIDRYDPTTGEKIWRWDWSKTLRQSQNNASFASAIARQVLSDNSLKGEWRDVPVGDWKFVDEAVESAYTNLRRERDAQTDPEKMEKKKEHRRRNKKRGLKEEKVKRRRKNWEEMKREGKEGKVRPVGIDEEDMERAFEIKYMSSEEEASDSLPPTAPLIHRGTQGERDKTFVVSRPQWRSKALAKFYTDLDEFKTLERAYTRFAGEDRKSLPPKGTPQWMVGEGFAEEEED